MIVQQLDNHIQVAFAPLFLTKQQQKTNEILNY